MLVCPNCGGNVTEDASEIITEKDGKFIVDAFPAKVCENQCGYVERID